MWPDLEPEALRLKRPQMQMVFQDPQASLNPRMTLAEPSLPNRWWNTPP